MGVCEKYGIPKELGFGFDMVLMPLLYVSKWDTNIWFLLMGYRRFGNPKIGHFGPNGTYTGQTRPFGPKCPIFGFPDLQYRVSKSQMLVSHFDTYSNSIKTT